MTTDFGFDFRATSGFVTDPNYAAAVLQDNYPNVYTNALSNTITAGFSQNESMSNMANRNSGNDPRLAGINYNAGNAISPFFTVFEVALPSTGTWSIALAAGDASNPQSQYIQFLDNGVAFATYTGVATASNSFMDANGTVWTEANWVTSNTTLSHLFTSTVFTVQIGPTTSTGSMNSTVAHLRVTFVPQIFMLGHT